MDQELQNILYDRYPKLFRQKGWTIYESCMPWGIECGGGWFHIIDNVCRIIQNRIDWERRARATDLWYNRALKRALVGDRRSLAYFYRKLYAETDAVERRVAEEVGRATFRTARERAHQVQFTQIKEKYGTLRLYINCHDDWVDGAIAMAETMSGTTCKTCGKPGKLRGTAWYYTGCDEHTAPGDAAEEDPPAATETPENP